MDIESQWMILGGLFILMYCLWIVIGKPNGTEIFFALISPLGYLDKAAFRVAEIANDENQPPLKRNLARLTRYIGLKLLFLAVFLGVAAITYGRVIRRAFGWH